LKLNYPDSNIESKSGIGIRNHQEYPDQYACKSVFFYSPAKKTVAANIFNGPGQMGLDVQ